MDDEPPGILFAQVFPYEDKGLTPHMKAIFYPTRCGGQTMVEAHGIVVTKWKARKLKSRLEPHQTNAARGA
jgi:hypothetical protein